LLADPATISGFRLDKYDVTVGRFRSFVSAWNAGTGWKPPAGSGKHGHLNGGQGLVNSASDAGISYESGWDATGWNALVAPTDANLACEPSQSSWTPSAATHEDLPINCVNWFEAYAFCIWDGGFLPSEAEWEYVAAAGDDEREYPWGSTAPGTANQYAIYGCHYPSGDAGATCSTENVAPVGTAALGAGRWGQLDLIGNVTQWNLDWYVPAYVNPCVDCAYLTTPGGTSGPWRVVRGDDFSSTYWSELLPTGRGQNAPTFRGATFGVRCARTP
jgi:formylglycine-generating enzyme required for sulfatase activity